MLNKINKKVCILLLHNTKETGLYEYARIYHQVYQNSEIVLLSQLYSNISQWEILFRFSFYRKRIEKKIKEELSSYEIIHICDNPIYSLNVIKILNKYKINTIYTLHDPESHYEKSIKDNLKKRLKIKLQNYSLNKISNFKFVKIHIHSVWRSINFKNVIVYPHPLYHIASATNKLDSPDEDGFFTIGFFGRIEYYKGIDLFLEILKTLDVNVSINKVKVLIVGKGKIDPSFKVKNLTIEIHNYYVKDNHFDKMLSICDLVLLPYRQASQSGVLMKTMTFNIPVIVSSIKELADYVEDEKTGYVLNINDINDWSSTILSLIESPEVVREMSLEIETNKKKYEPLNIALKLYS